MKQVLLATAIILGFLQVSLAQVKTAPERQTTPPQPNRIPRISAKEARDLGATDKQIADMEAANDASSTQLSEAAKMTDLKMKNERYAAIELERSNRYAQIFSPAQMDSLRSNRDMRRDSTRSNMQKQMKSDQKSKTEGPGGQTVPLERKKG